MDEYYCPGEKDAIKASGTIEAWKKLRCGDCSMQKDCGGPVYRGATKWTPPASPGRKPKAKTPEDSTTAAEAPAVDNDASCRAALLELCKRVTTLSRQRAATEVVGKFQKEIAAARGAGVGWKPIAKTLRDHGFSLGWNAAQRAFERLGKN